VRRETLVGGRNLVTPHAPEDYPGLLVVRPGPRWTVSVIVPKDGETIVAKGGEEMYAYRTPDGAVAQGFRLQAGESATLVRSGLPHSMVEWRIDRE
jgi:hypothetical protein